MRSPTDAPIEIVTGLGGTGAEIMLAHIGDAPLQTHPMIPMLQVSADARVQQRFDADLDLRLPTDASALEETVNQLSDRIADVASRHYVPSLSQRRLSGFQVTRGLLGISM